MHNTTVSEEIINYVNTNEKNFVDFIVVNFLKRFKVD